MALNQPPRTIFITSFHGLVSRILESGFLDYLLETNNLRVVIFVPDFKCDYFLKTFGNKKGVVIEGVGRACLPRRVFAFHKLTFILLHTRTMKLIRRSFRGYRHFYQALLAQLTASCLGRWWLVRQLFRAMNYYFSGPMVFAGYFDKYQPEVVFSTDIKELLDSQLLIEAKKRKIFTVGMVRSWDYLTGKGMTRVKPDKMVVHNEVIKWEAQQYADMAARDIFISGIPHYDPYINEPRIRRDQFFEKIGGDSAERLVFYAPWGDKFADTDWQFLEMLSDAIGRGELPKGLQILVRLPPGDTVALGRLNRRSEIIVEAPGVTFDKLHRKANEMSYQDLLHLADSLFWSDVVVTPPSTIAIDAAVFNKPVVLMAFDGFQQKGYYQGVGHYYDFDHIRNLVKTGGQKLVRSQTELIDAVRQYLENPTLDQPGRARLVREQCWRLDGQAGKRLAKFLSFFVS